MASVVSAVSVASPQYNVGDKVRYYTLPSGKESEGKITDIVTSITYTVTSPSGLPAAVDPQKIIRKVEGGRKGARKTRRNVRR
jgi:hypothetical protein